MDKNLEYEPIRGAHILMIVNPVSGRIGGAHTADKLEAWLKENGAAVDRFETTETENGSGYTAKLAENDYARVVVLGGDGTLNAVLNGMLHRALRGKGGAACMASSFEIKSTRPSVGETIVTIVRDHIDYRKQIFKLAGSDLRRTYRASALGWSWAIIKPLVTIFVYWFAFAIGLRRGGDIEGYPFVLWLISGIVPWFYMSEMLTLGTECILRNRYLVTKMKYPVSTIPTFTSISKFSVHLILMMITILIFVITGNELTIYLVQLPFYMLCNFLFFTGWAMFAAPIAAISTDFSNLVKSFVTAVFWLSGVLFQVDTMHKGLAHKLLMLNPVTFLCNGYRNCFIYHTWFFDQPKRLLYFAVWLVVIYALGIWSYRRTRSEMADVL